MPGHTQQHCQWQPHVGQDAAFKEGFPSHRCDLHMLRGHSEACSVPCKWRLAPNLPASLRCFSSSVSGCPHHLGQKAKVAFQTEACSALQWQARTSCSPDVSLPGIVRRPQQTPSCRAHPLPLLLSGCRPGRGWQWPAGLECVSSPQRPSFFPPSF